MYVTEYQSEHKQCNQCGYTTAACFPETLTHKTQYGPRAKSLMVYRNQYHRIPPGTFAIFLGAFCSYRSVIAGLYLHLF